MSRCECKSGFFALRDCSELPIAHCTNCKRAICSVHRAAASDAPLCRDCVARRDQAPRRDGSGAAYDDNWAYSYRSHFYGAGYAPAYLGSRRSAYYDSNDARSFVATNDEIDDNSDPRAGFGDS